MGQGLRMELSEDEAIYIFDQLDEEQYGFVDFDTFCSWAARRNLELSRQAAEMGAADFLGEQRRGLELPPGNESALGVSIDLEDPVGADDESSFGAQLGTGNSSLEAALAVAEMSAPSWSDM